MHVPNRPTPIELDTCQLRASVRAVKKCIRVNSQDFCIAVSGWAAEAEKQTAAFSGQAFDIDAPLAY